MTYYWTISTRHIPLSEKNEKIKAREQKNLTAATLLTDITRRERDVCCVFRCFVDDGDSSRVEVLSASFQ